MRVQKYVVFRIDRAPRLGLIVLKGVFEEGAKSRDKKVGGAR